VIALQVSFNRSDSLANADMFAAGIKARQSSWPEDAETTLGPLALPATSPHLASMLLLILDSFPAKFQARMRALEPGPRTARDVHPVFFRFANQPQFRERAFFE
jgi:hypothetical protein